MPCHNPVGIFWPLKHSTKSSQGRGSYCAAAGEVRVYALQAVLLRRSISLVGRNIFALIGVYWSLEHGDLSSAYLGHIRMFQWISSSACGFSQGLEDGAASTIL